MHAPSTDLLDGRYRIRKSIGKGGYGIVYLTSDELLQRDVAVKIMTTGMAFDDERRKRLVREAKALAMLKHPNIIEIHRLGFLHDGRPYVAMEYFDGQSLSDKLKQGGPLNCSRATSICIEIAKALAHAHSTGVLHRDLKPQNVLVASSEEHPQIKLVDFGLSAMTDEAKPDQTRLTRTGATVGSPEYMSPEQCRGQSLDARSDIYSLGITFFEMLTGKCPFAAEDIIGSMKMQLEQPLPALIGINRKAGVPPLLQEILIKSTCKNPEQRYTNVEAMLSDLSELAAQNCTQSFRAAAPRHNRPRKRVVWLLAASAGIGCLVTCVLVFLHGQSPSPRVAVSSEFESRARTSERLMHLGEKISQLPMAPSTLSQIDSELQDIERHIPREHDYTTEGLLATMYFALIHYHRQDATHTSLLAQHGRDWVEELIRRHRPDADLIYASQTVTAGLLQVHRIEQAQHIYELLSDKYASQPASAGMAMSHVLHSEILLAEGNSQAALAECRVALPLLLATVQEGPRAPWLDTLYFADQQLESFPQNDRSILVDRKNVNLRWLARCKEDGEQTPRLFSQAFTLGKLAAIEKALGDRKEASVTESEARERSRLAWSSSSAQERPILRDIMQGRASLLRATTIQPR
jgi:serine/threonine protein kinase